MRLLRETISIVTLTGFILITGSACANDAEPAVDSTESSTSFESSKASESATETAESESTVTKGTETSALTLQEIVRLQNEAIEPQLEALKELFSDIKIEADEPDGISYSYTYAFDVPTAETADGIETESDALESTAEAIFPALEQTGIDNPTVTFRYINADGSLIWERVFHQN